MSNQPKNKKETPVREFIALQLIDNVGASRIRLLLQHVDHPQDVFRMNRQDLEAIRGIGPKTARDIVAFNEWNEVDEILKKTARVGSTIMTYWDDDYPQLLREIYDPPILLWIKGSRSALSHEGIAIVGTRKAGDYGLDMARKFAASLSDQGLSIISGLAYGVDGAAHAAAVKAGGCTVAVLGSGIDVIYPSQHKKLAADIVDSGGTVISEFPLGAAPDASNFPVRNRIVSGMSLGTLVVESGINGGSMITAQSALEQNREVFVIPHALANPHGIGCNHLIKRGAGKLVQSADDILEELPHYHREDEKEAGKKVQEPNWKSRDLDEESEAICKLLKDRAMHIDDLSEELGKASYQLLPKLLELEMQECVRQKAGKNFELR